MPGGKKPGAGRPKGMKNKKTMVLQELLDRARKNRKTPLEVMLENVDYAMGRAEQCVDDEDEQERWREKAQRYANDAAPYLHGKCRESGNIPPNVTFDLTGADDEQLKSFLNFYNQLLGQGGEATSTGSDSSGTVSTGTTETP